MNPDFTNEQAKGSRFPLFKWQSDDKIKFYGITTYDDFDFEMDNVKFY